MLLFIPHLCILCSICLFPLFSLCLNACDIGVPGYQTHKNAKKEYLAKSVRIISELSYYSLLNETQTETVVLIYHSVQVRKLLQLVGLFLYRLKASLQINVNSTGKTVKQFPDKSLILRGTYKFKQIFSRI